jgi:hypothetical protein
MTVTNVESDRYCWLQHYWFVQSTHGHFESRKNYDTVQAGFKTWVNSANEKVRLC